MKRGIIAWIFTAAMLLPACVDLTSSVSVEVDSSSASGNSVDMGKRDCEHTDDNNDGNCDICAKNVLVTLDFYVINDLHGKFDDTEAQIGVDELSTYLKTAKENNPYTFLLSSGDMWQGSAESNITKGTLMTEWMNEMNFISMTLGNHEFDWGTSYIQTNAELAEFPFLGINIFDKTTNERADYCHPSIVVEQGELKVGVIGAIGNCLSSISGEHSQSLDFKTGTELTNLVKTEATRLRNEEGVDFVVYSLHENYMEEYATILSCGYVDLVFEGHSHQSYVKLDSYGVYHLQAGGDNEKGISHAKVRLNTANEDYTVQGEVISPSVYQNLADDPVVENLLDKYEEQIAPVYEPLGQNACKRQSSEILALCAKLYYETGVEKWGETYDIFLGGGYMSARAPYYFPAGTLNYADLMNVLPFDNQLVLCSIKGSDLKTRFLETDNERYYIYCGQYGESNREDVEDDEIYYLITDTYSSTYAPNNLTEIERYTEKTAQGEYFFARDLLAEYIKEGKWSS